MNIQDHRVREIDSLNDGPYETGYQNYSSRFLNQFQQCQQFARYNSSLLIVVSTIIVIVTGGVFLYFFYKDAADFLPFNFISGSPQSEDVNFSPILKIMNPQYLRCESFNAEPEIITLDIISYPKYLNTWEKLQLDCQDAVKKLSLTGSFSYNDLHSFSRTFINLEKLWISGPDLCNYILPNLSTLQNLSTTANNNESEIHFDKLLFLSISNISKDCDELFNSVLEKSSTKVLTEFHLDKVFVSPRVNELIQSVLASSKISNMSLTDLIY